MEAVAIEMIENLKGIKLFALKCRVQEYAAGNNSKFGLNKYPDVPPHKLFTCFI